MESKKSILLDIFLNEEDKIGNDLLKMSDFLDVFIKKTSDNIYKAESWKKFEAREDLLTQIKYEIKNMIGSEIEKN